MSYKNLSALLLVPVSLLLASCAGVQELVKAREIPLTAEPEPIIQEDGTELSSEGIDFNNTFKTYLNPDKDPYQQFNRESFYLNYYILDKYILRPLAIANREYVSPDLEASLVSAYNYTVEPFTLVSNLATNQPYAARDNLTRLVLNGVFGLGMIDWGAELGFFSNENSFNDVLAYYGTKPGSYVMFPGFGPTYTRKFIGDTLLQSAASSIAYKAAFGLTSITTLPLTAYRIVSLRTSLLDQEPLLVNAPDPYTVVKSVYIQNQNFAQGKALNQPIPEATHEEIDEDILDLIN